MSILKVNDHIKVFIDTDKMIDVKDDTFSNGPVLISAKNSKNLVLDDVCVYQVSSTDFDDAIFKNRKVRIMNTVLDNLGATGGIAPIMAVGERDEEELWNVCNAYFGLKEKTTALTVNGDWMTHSSAFNFKPICGYGKKAGYILGCPLDDLSENLLWSWRSFYGDFSMQMDVSNASGKIGWILYDKKKGVKNYIGFIINTVEKTLEVLNDGKVVESKPIKYEQVKDAWNNIKIVKEGNDLSFSVDNKQLATLKLEHKNTYFKPAVYFKKGSVKLDNLIGYVQPNKAYDFSHNQLYTLNLSDWEELPKKNVPAFLGGYYSYIYCVAKGTTNYSLISKKKYSGDIAVEFLIDTGAEMPVDLFIKVSKEVNLVLKINENTVKLLNNNKVLVSSHVGRDLTFRTTFFSYFYEIENDELTFYLTDKKGTQLKALTFNISKFVKDKEYSIGIGTSKELGIKQISIWSK